MSLHDDTIAYQQLLETLRLVPEDIEVEEDTRKALAQVEIAWLEHIIQLTEADR